VEWLEILRPLFDQHGIYFALAGALIICGLGLPVPEEAIFLAAGYFGRRVGADPWLLCAAGLVGVLIGDLIPFLAGRYFSKQLQQKAFFQRWWLARYRPQIEAFFASHGSKTIFIARFIAGLRTPTFVMAGAARMPIHTFLLWDMLGALVSCPVAIFLAYWFGERAVQWVADSQVYIYVVVSGLIALFIVRALRQRAAVRAEALRNGRPPEPGLLNRACYFSARFIFKVTMKVLFRYEVRGAERIPASGPVILIANHASFIDPIFVACATGRFVQYLMYSTFYRSIARPVFELCCTIPVDEKDFLAALKSGVRALQQGACVGIFPEGAVSHDGKLLPAKAGAFFIAQRAGVPVVPLAICGNHGALPRGAWFPRPRKVTVLVGEPIQVSRDLSKDDVQALLDKTMFEIAEKAGALPPSTIIPSATLAQ